MRRIIFILLLCLAVPANGQFAPHQKPCLGYQINRGHQLGDPAGAWFFQEGSGNKVYDLSGNVNTGVFEGDPQWTATKFGSGVIHDGTGDFINCGNKGVLNVQSFSISILINFQDVTSLDVGVIGKWETNVTKQYLAIQVNNQLRLYLSADGSTSTCYRANATALVINTWYHFVWVYDATAQTLHVYRNGVLDDGDLSGTVPASIYTGTSNFKIGTYYNTEDMIATVDNASLFNRALSASEIALLYSEPFCMLKQDDIALKYTEEAPPAGGGQVIIIQTVAPIILMTLFMVMKRKRC